ncbi:hypothetical protein V490_01788 [Pseudogymnoascus sp. VKM F-3557]|nr:hypothetical protein V490_01788 [Pseudogymnoascus sp. VKM F-3557]
MPSTSNLVGTPLQQDLLPTNLTYLLLIFMKDSSPLLITILFAILYCFPYFSLLGLWSLARTALQRTAYPYNRHEPIAPNNFYGNNPQARYAAPPIFYDNDAQAGYAAPRNFNNNNAQAGSAALYNIPDDDARAGYTAPCNSLQIQIARHGPVLNYIVKSPSETLLSSSITKKDCVSFKSVPPSMRGRR